MKTEDSGSHCEYYHAEVTHPSNPGQSGGYVANCEDIIQALGLTFDEGCEFKSIWRRGRARQGFVKAESTPLRDAVKAVHYANRVLAMEQRLAVLQATQSAPAPPGAMYDWARVDPKYNWLATDASGLVFAYVEKPLLVGCASGWTGSGRLQKLTPVAPWSKSLEKRP